eukprot:1159339-Pelagomonas_calceolata.AAC.5
MMKQGMDCTGTQQTGTCKCMLRIETGSKNFEGLLPDQQHILEEIVQNPTAPLVTKPHPNH